MKVRASLGTGHIQPGSAAERRNWVVWLFAALCSGLYRTIRYPEFMQQMPSLVYPGTFDPITYGHLDLSRRACQLFGQITFAIAGSSAKNPLFSVSKRMDMARRIFADEGLNVDVVSFDGLLVELMHKRKGKIILRGLRAISDFEYELQLANTNRVLLPSVETLFLTPAVEYAYISSTMVREIASLGGDVSALVHPIVQQELYKALYKT